MIRECLDLISRQADVCRCKLQGLLGESHSVQCFGNRTPLQSLHSSTHMVCVSVTISTCLQETCSHILAMTTSLTQLIRANAQLGEDQDQLNKMYIDIAAIAKRTWDAKESRDTFLHSQVCEICSPFP